jgi:hypothetical protein
MAFGPAAGELQEPLARNGLEGIGAGDAGRSLHLFLEFTRIDFAIKK